MYRIKYEYRTGDSFHTEDREEILEYEWKNLDVVKECLKRIREHYKWYESIENHYAYRHEKVEKPAWHNIQKQDYIMGNEHCLINLPLDNGKEIQFWPPWCGYFEQLYGAEIVPCDNDMKFTV